MKTIGILGGLSAESTLSYYQRITREYIRLFGKPAYPEIVIYSVNFQQYVDWQHHGEWDKCRGHMLSCMHALSRAGAGFALIASNTMHMVLPDMQPNLPLPVLSIVDSVAQATRAAGLKKVALFGTGFTMEKDFYPVGLAQNGVDCIVPDKADREMIHGIIYSELVNGIITEESRSRFVNAVSKVKARGAQGVIMGCTEIPLLLSPEHVDLPLFDSANIHADAALSLAISG